MMRIEQLRKEKHMSQIQLSMQLNVSQPTISTYETGERKPDSETLIKLSKFFSVSIDYLVGISDIRNPITLSELTPREVEHLYLFRRISKSEQDKTDGFIMSFLNV